MKILGIESSAKAASAAVYEDGRLLGQYFQNSGLTHSRTLLPMIEALLNNLELAMDGIGLIAVAHGPGSFTGVRIGVGTAKGLAWASDKPICGVSALEAMAWQAVHMDGIICCAMDARRNEIYNAKFEMSGGALLRLCSDRAISLEILRSEAENDKKPYLLVGDGAELCYNYLKEGKIPAVLLPEHIRFQSAWGVCLSALSAEHKVAGDIAPVYLRLSQAERQRLEKGV